MASATLHMTSSIAIKMTHKSMNFHLKIRKNDTYSIKTCNFTYARRKSKISICFTFVDI